MPISLIGKYMLFLVNELGGWAIFSGKALRLMLVWPFPIKKVIAQIYQIGVKSIPVILFVGLFSGMVLGLQGYYTLVQFGSEGLLGAAVALTLIRELGPVLTVIMVVGQAGSSMAAEIGIMRNSEQIDALVTMDINPLRYLVGPRIVASIIAIPLLTAIFDIIGIIGGHITGVILLGLDSGAYWNRIEYNVVMKDISGGFYKAFTFAFLISSICCYQGFFTHLRAKGFGARGVSASATSAVIFSSVVVLVADYVLTSILL